MANINPLDPSTFHLSSQQQSSIYRYIVQINPRDPSRYTGPRLITVSSAELMSEEQILDIAFAFGVTNKSGFGFEDVESFTLADALIGKNFQ